MTLNATGKLSFDNELHKLCANAALWRQQNLDYAGNVTPQDAYDFLSKNKAILVDVRTIPEWQFVGTPDISKTGSKLIHLSWKIYPSFSLNPNFVNSLKDDDSVTEDSVLFFLCRSGGRSLDAAVAMTAQGFNYCFNIAYGFEGDTDANGHRGQAGWKHDNLPWIQG